MYNCRLPPQFYLPSMVAGTLPISQLQMLQPQTQISPSAAAQYQTLADYAAYGAYPGMSGSK